MNSTEETKRQDTEPYWKGTIGPCGCGCGETIGMMETVWWVPEDKKGYKRGHQPPNVDHYDSDRNFLEWLRERLIYIHGEKENVDYMLRFYSIIQSLSRDRHTPNTKFP